MIICVNGKSVGCMTEAELQLDLELCGSEMMLVVARFDIEGNTNQDVTLADLAMEWNDIGAGAHPRKKTVCFEDEESSENRYDLDLIPKNTSIQVQDRPDSESHDDGNDRPERESHVDDNDDSANEEENENENDGLDGAEDASSFDWVPRRTSELESKSDEVLMRQLIDTVESGNWDRHKGSQMANLLARRGFLAAANDERFQRFCCNSGGVTKEQALEWMSRSETFQHYERTVRAKWSESTFQNRTSDALKDVGYTKVSGGGSGVLARYALPEDILSRELQFENVMNQNYQSDEEGTSEDDDGPEDTSFDRVPKVNSELESKSDEVLMRQLIDTVESGNWDRHKGSQMANLLARRGFLAAANDERFQRFCCNSGGVTKEQALEWMSRSETFQHYERTVRAKWSESTFQNRTSDALKDAGYTKPHNARRWSLPEAILSRDKLQRENQSSQNCQSDETGENDDDDGPEDTSFDWAPRVDLELESKSDKELMDQLINTVEAGKWKQGKDSQLAKLLAKRGLLAAANDESFQRLSCNSGGVTKEQALEWMSRSEIFQQYEQTVRAKWSESTFQNHTWDALKDVGYTKISGGGSGVLARYALPEDILSRELQLPNVKSQNYQSDDEATSDEEDSDIRKQGRTNLDIFVSELESKSDEELMQQLIDTVESGNWNKVKDPQLAKLLAKRAFLAAANDETFQKLSCNSGGVTKEQVFEWMSRSATFQQYEQIMRAKWSESTFQNRTWDALKDVGYTKISGGGSGVLARYALPEDILSRELQLPNVTSRNYQSDDDATSDAEDSDIRKQGRRKVDIFESELESKSDEELMQQLIDTVESGDWKYEISPLAKLLMKRAFLAAAKDERFQRLSCSSGGVTKDQPFEWMSRSETFHQYERIVRANWSESSFQTYAGSALKDAGYTIVRGHRSVARYLLPEDILSRELQRKNVPRVGNNVVPNTSKQKAIENAGSNAGKRKRSDTFAKRKKQFNLYFDDSQSGFEEESENEEEEEEDDDNPWLGCVCGRTHPPPIQVFWIQCGACDAWHNVAEDCVGFSEEVANTIDDWHCWSCNPPCAGLNL